MERWIAQLRKGLVELSVLAVLKDGEAYGYQILQRLSEAEEVLVVSESTVYPILARLTKERSLRVRIASSPAGPPRRYYELTETGRQRLEEMHAYWSRLNGAVTALFRGKRHGSVAI